MFECQVPLDFHGRVPRGPHRSTRPRTCPDPVEVKKRANRWISHRSKKSRAATRRFSHSATQSVWPVPPLTYKQLEQRSKVGSLWDWMENSDKRTRVRIQEEESKKQKGENTKLITAFKNIMTLKQFGSSSVAKNNTAQSNDVLKKFVARHKSNIAMLDKDVNALHPSLWENENSADIARDCGVPTGKIDRLKLIYGGFVRADGSLLRTPFQQLISQLIRIGKGKLSDEILDEIWDLFLADTPAAIAVNFRQFALFFFQKLAAVMPQGDDLGLQWSATTFSQLKEQCRATTDQALEAPNTGTASAAKVITQRNRPRTGLSADSAPLNSIPEKQCLLEAEKAYEMHTNLQKLQKSVNEKISNSEEVNRLRTAILKEMRMKI